MNLNCDKKVFVFLFLSLILTLSVCFFIHNNDYSHPPMNLQVSNSSYLGAKKSVENTKESVPEFEYLDFENNPVDWDAGFKDCGYPMEGCDEMDSHPDYFNSPKYCRCDNACVKYGDCCVTVLKKIKKINTQSYWRCVSLPHSDHGVRMISMCPRNYTDSINKQLCEDGKCLNEDPLNCPWLDIPVLHKESRDLYRNIYCARCHGISNSELYKIRQWSNCSQPLNKTQFEVFKNDSIYHQGKLLWEDRVDPEFTCRMYIKEFFHDTIETYSPGVRFCPVSVQENCGLYGDPLVGYLCHAYMQVVNFPVKIRGSIQHVPFKNPHCAICQASETIVNIRRAGQCNRLPARQPRVDCNDSDDSKGNNVVNSGASGMSNFAIVMVIWTLIFL